MVDTQKIAAARSEHAELVLPTLSHFLLEMDDARGGDAVACGPRLQFIEARPAGENDTELIARIEPEHPSSAAIWTQGLDVGLWIHSGRIGCLAASKPDWHAKMRAMIIATAVSAQLAVTDPDTGLVRMERITYAVDSHDNTYTLRQVIIGPNAGIVDLTQGHLDPRWNEQEIEEYAEDYGYRQTHVVLARIQATFDCPHETIAEAARQGAFDLDEAIQARLVDPVDDQSAVADIRDLVAAHGFLPWDHRQDAT